MRIQQWLQPGQFRPAIASCGLAFIHEGFGIEKIGIHQTGKQHAQPQGIGSRRLRRSVEHTSELQSLMRISYAVFCLKKKKNKNESKHIVSHMTHTQQQKKTK